jgi:hypothetical protein
MSISSNAKYLRAEPAVLAGRVRLAGWGQERSGSAEPVCRAELGRQAPSLSRLGDSSTQAQSRAYGVEPARQPTRASPADGHIPSGLATKSPSPGSRTRPCGFEDRCASVTLAKSVCVGAEPDSRCPWVDRSRIGSGPFPRRGIGTNSRAGRCSRGCRRVSIRGGPAAS